MVIKRMTVVLPALALVLGPSLSRAGADQSSAAQPAQPGAETNQGSQVINGNTPGSTMGSLQAVQAPPADWKQLVGMVQTIDQSAKTVEIKDDSGKLLEIPVDRHVKIERDGKGVKLSQLQVGDSITLAKKNVSAQEEGSKTY